MSPAHRTPRLRSARRRVRHPDHVVLVLPGGDESSHRTGVSAFGVVAALPFVRDVRRATRRSKTAIHVLHYRYAGWNEPDAPGVADTHWAFGQLRDRYGDIPVTIVAMSLGARVALRVGLEPNVRALALIAPWFPRDEDVSVLAGRDVLIVHGSRDKEADPLASYEHAVRARAAGARVARFVLRGAGHGQVPLARYSLALVRAFVAASAGLAPMPTVIERAMEGHGDEGLDLQLPRRRRR
jgi:pimeloyl-ACP methyl ester carboxylesterase